MTAAIIIDPTARTVAIDSTPDAGWQSIRAAIGCDSVDMVRLGQIAGMSVDLWVDDEGLYSGAPGFALPGMHPLAGRAVLLFSDDEGESHGLDALLTPDQVERIRAKIEGDVQWVAVEDLPEPRFEFIPLS